MAGGEGLPWFRQLAKQGGAGSRATLAAMTLYFAYGTNMDRTAMRARCPGARAIGTGTLEGWRLLVMRDGYVSIAKRPTAIVHGVLWRLGPPDLAALDAYESIATGLYRRQVLAVLVGGRRISAQVYVGRSTDTGRPRPGHMSKVIAAARSWRFPARYLDEMQQWSSPRMAKRQAHAGESR